jgi:CPA1 family monovalent cation:H+ antiporter
LPDGDTAFPHRDLIVFCAFCVVLATLVIQGATLKPLLKLLGLRDDGTVEREIETARVETARAALQELENKTPSPDVEILRREYQARMQPGSPEPDNLADLQQHAALAQRRALVDLRARSVIGDDAFHAAEEEIDLLELTANARIRPLVEGDALTTREAPGPQSRLAGGPCGGMGDLNCVRATKKFVSKRACPLPARENSHLIDRTSSDRQATQQ